MNRENWIDIAYLVAAVGFIVSLKLLKSPLTARKGNWVAMGGMAIALAATMFHSEIKTKNLIYIGASLLIGSVIAFVSSKKIQMTAVPQMVALLNGLGGGAVTLVALFEFLHTKQTGLPPETIQSVTTVLSAIIGSISFSGSMVAFAKLQELLPGRPLTFPGQQVFNLLLVIVLVALALSILVFNVTTVPVFLVLVILSLVLGVFAVMPIGGADMPVVISLLNSFTGCAAGLAGFVLLNSALLIGGGLVGASGLILTLEMCVAMNRSLGNVLFGAVGATISTGPNAALAGKQPKSFSEEDAAILLMNANTVVIVPGYGMAVAQAQHQVKEMASKLMAVGIGVKYAVHPVAGRMPGHMNVLLAEADVPYEQLYELDQINPMFAETDVVIVIGANDVVNPAARYDKGSPIYGMPILDVDKARNVLVIKRGMGSGFAGVENELFLYDNTAMVFGSAKPVVAKIASALDNY